MFGKKLKRFATVIALIGALASSCKKKAPENVADNINQKAARIEASLSEGKLNENAVREFVLFIRQAERDFKIKLELPPNLEEGISSLKQFYDMYDFIVKMNTEDSPIDGVRAAACSEYLYKAEKYIGIKLNQERKALKDALINQTLVIDKKIKSGRGFKSSLTDAKNAISRVISML